ncbi:MAG TPA: hypothetical protein VFB27_05815 [Opitutaceae bacterium]|nr:hypothetical protein [Opitutaceae bacterium]
MDKNLPNNGILTENFARIGPVTREMVHARAHELALIAGHASPHVSQADYEEAKRELMGISNLDQQEMVLDSISEAKRWDTVPGSTGCQAPESASEDEDDEGRSESAQLVEEGIEEAERDQIHQAARAAEKRDGREL